MRGAAYGLRQGLDTLGALAGPLIAVGLMAHFAGNFRAVFWFSCIPAVACVMTLVLGRQGAGASTVRVKREPFPLMPSQLKRLSADFWILIGVIFLLLLPRFSESLLLLRAQNVGLAATWVPLVFVAMNLVYAPIAAVSWGSWSKISTIFPCASMPW